MNKFKSLKFILLLLFSFVAINFGINATAEATRPIVFPVLGKSSFTNDFDAPRYLRGKYVKHRATDIIAKKGQQLVAVVNGTIVDVQYPQPDWGWSVTIEDAEGYQYTYIHLNDDTPGTNDGRGGPMRAYAPDVQEGNRVAMGQLIGKVGDSGFSNGIPHLHFEMYAPNGGVLNPYHSLKRAHRISRPTIPPALPGEVLPYGRYFNSEASIDMAQFDGDNQSEFVTGAGKGGSPHLKAYDHNNSQINGFYAYNPSFKGGISVAAGDVDNDGVDEIITGAGPGGGPHLKVFEVNGTTRGSFYAYNPSFKGGISVAAGDVDNDGVDEIITGAGPGGSPHVKVFELNGTTKSSFYAYSPSFHGGVDVTSADVLGGSEHELITGAGPGGGSHVRVLNMSGAELASFGAYGGSHKGGVKVSAGNVRTASVKAEILTVPAVGHTPHIHMFNGSGGNIASTYFMERWWKGYHDIAAGNGSSKASTGINRRAAVKPGIQ